MMDAMEKAELLIFTTPTYCVRCSAPMKAFIDLTCTNWMPHKPRAWAFDKKALIISTAAGTGMKSAIKDVSTSLSYWGISRIWKYGVSVQAMGWKDVSAEKKRRIEGDVNKLSSKILDSRPVRPTVKTRFLFSVMRMMQLKNMGASKEEKAYWERMGWSGSVRPWNNR